MVIHMHLGKSFLQPITSATVKQFHFNKSINHINDEQKKKHYTSTTQQHNSNNNNKHLHNSSSKLRSLSPVTHQHNTTTTASTTTSLYHTTTHTLQNVAGIEQSNTELHNNNNNNTTTSSTPSIQVPFNIHRTSSDQLPVYTDYKKGNHVLTVLRRYTGDSNEIVKQVRLLLGSQVNVQQRNGKIVIDGQYTKQIKDWLEKIGF